MGSRDLDKWVNDKGMAIKDSKLVDRLKSYGHKPFDGTKIRRAAYRPFFYQYLYFDRVYNQAHYLMREFMPYPDTKNLFICVPYKFKNDFYAYVTDMTPDLEIVHHSQCFPFYYYVSGTRFENITDYAKNTVRNHYDEEAIKKIDIFDYVYGMLHHTGYRKQFRQQLKKVFAQNTTCKRLEKFLEV